MRRLLPLALAAACAAAPLAFAADKAPKTEKDKLSYSLGRQLGETVKANRIDVNPDVFSRAVKDALTGAKPAMSEAEMRSTLEVFSRTMQERQIAALKAMAAKNKKDSEAFLAANKKKKGVVTLPNGVQYKVIKEGKGKKPTLDDTVVVNYTGSLINGKEFDSSAAHGKPATFALNGTIKGFQQVLQMMPEGSKWEIYIPPELGYGERGAGPIPPNSALIFDIDLVSIKHEAKPKSG